MFIIDFDDTLFETERFKQARLRAVATLGIAEELYWQTYREARNSPDGLFTYSNERHAEMLSRRGFKKDAVSTALDETVGDTLPHFLDPQAHNFLEGLKRYGETMVLLSLGDPSFQELKVKDSGVASYFDRLYMVEQTKTNVLKELLAHIAETEQAWFINDKPKETAELAARFPRLSAIAKMSPRFNETEYQEEKLVYFKTLAEIAQYVKEHHI